MLGDGEADEPRGVRVDLRTGEEALTTIWPDSVQAAPVALIVTALSIAVVVYLLRRRSR
jgi:hypothetical protein